MFRVQWVSSALNVLPEVWIAADPSETSLLSDVINAIEQQLALDPTEIGESREADRRILLVPPLAVKFRVQPGLRLVTVLDVWRYGKSR